MKQAKVKQVAEAVIQLVAERAGVSPTDITRETHFRDDLNFDSLDVVEMTISLEDAFGSSIPDHDVETFQTVGDVVDYVQRPIANAPEAA